MNTTRLIEHNGIWVIALAVGVSAYFIYFRKSRNEVKRDSNAEQIYSEIANKLSEQMKAPPEAVLAILRGGASPVPDQNLHFSIHLECTFRKLNASTAEIEIVAAYLKEGKPHTSTLRRELSWDEIPEDVRRDFIHTGKAELHYSMGNAIPSNDL